MVKAIPFFVPARTVPTHTHSTTARRHGEQRMNATGKPPGRTRQGEKTGTCGEKPHQARHKLECLGEQSKNKSFERSFKSFVFTLLTETWNFARRAVEVYA